MCQYSENRKFTDKEILEMVENAAVSLVIISWKLCQQLLHEPLCGGVTHFLADVLLCLHCAGGHEPSVLCSLMVSILRRIPRQKEFSTHIFLFLLLIPSLWGWLLMIQLRPKKLWLTFIESFFVIFRIVSVFSIFLSNPWQWRARVNKQNSLNT
jgi:hypothetical protein